MKRIIIVIVLVVALLFVVKEDHSKTKEIQIEKKNVIANEIQFDEKSKGNDDWNQSAPHGAGRIMSRMKAKETFKLDEFKESMKDIYTTSVNEDTIDEAPFVYKSMKEIIDAIEDTVEIVKIITPVYNFKAN